MTCIDGFVAAVPIAHHNTYRDYAGNVTSFPMAGKLGKDGARCSRESSGRRKKSATPAEDPAHRRFDPATNPMPFDGKRMTHGGFVPIAEA